MTDIVLIYAQLFWVFFLIGIFTFGGGYAMLSLIQTQVVTAHHWISESTFTNIVAISQMTPGPIGVNCATYTGYEVLASAGAGHATAILGSAVATFALILPSFFIVLAMVKFYQKFIGNSLFDGVMSWLRPTVTGLIGAAAVILITDVSWGGFPGLSSPHFSIIRDNFIDWKSWALFGAAMVASLKFKVSPITIIIAGGILGLLLY
jgi:chromate transporter